MESVSIQLQIVAVLAIVGALIETFLPGFFSENAKSTFTVITIVIIGVLLSFLLLMWFLKLRVREGFEDALYLTRWKRLMQENKTKEVCELYKEIYDKMYTVEKGAPPLEVKTDAQAREAVDAKFAKLMVVKPMACDQIERLNESTRLDSFYLNSVKIPQNVLIQVYETAVACRSLLKETYDRIKDAEKKREEGFQDKPLCEDKAAEERRQFLERKPLSKEAEQCLLPEEIPAQQKEKVVITRLDNIESTFESYMKVKPIKDPITKVLDDCKIYKTEIDKKKKETEALFGKFEDKKL